MNRLILFIMTLLFVSVVFPLALMGNPDDVKTVESELLKKASDNIEKYRKGNAVIAFKNKSGKPFQNVKVEINQETHDFLFGNIIFSLVRSRGDRTFNAERYKQRFKELFNFACSLIYIASSYQFIISISHPCN